MTLAIGTRLGPYEITGAIGAGGMGEVFRARDTKLNRDVAIKVLPAALARDAERVSRFRREAQILATLNHPNIGAIYGLEESPETGSGQAAVVALVMELVGGEDLAERLKRGALPVDEAIAIVRQIAEALEEAHEHGIVHRDLKPANIKITADGKVKVLDFGLAKALEGEAGDAANPQLSHSPTMSRHATEAGLILGTAAYMSPEQARGKPVDKRADIWSFGVVLFEMLTGERLFAGETVSDTLASVLKEDVPWTTLPAGTPRGVVQLLKRCLVRDPRLRMRDMGEARLALAAAETPEPNDLQSATTRPVQFWFGIAAACLAAGVVGGLGVSRWSASSLKTTDRPVRSLILPTEGRGLLDSQAISPDGRFVAYTAGGSLWIRNLRELEAREVKDSKGARQPFWSPRSDAIAFATEKALFKVSLDGEKPVELCRLSGGAFTGGSWSAIKGIVFTLARANLNGDVLRVSEAGGEAEVFTRADPAKKEHRLHQPHFLPDGRNLLYTVVTVDANGGQIAVDRDGTRTLLGLSNASTESAYAASSHVLFTRGFAGSRALWAVPFSLSTLTTTGEAFLVARDGGGATASEDGTILYGRDRADPEQLVWVDRAGKVLGTIGEPAPFSQVPSISPDGSRVAVSNEAGRIGVWDAQRGIETRLLGESETAFSGDWLPGGEEFAYAPYGAVEVLKVRRADGTGEPRVLLERRGFGPCFSKDGAYMAFYALDAETGRDLWAVALDKLKKKEEPFLILKTSANEALPRISPDGKWLAYQSDASNQWEVYVQPFPRGEGRLQVSKGGGQHPMWNPEGGELFYVSGNELMAVDIVANPTLRTGTPRRLFSGDALETRLALVNQIERFYDVAPDGRRFVVVKGNGTGKSDVVLAEGALTRVPPGRP